MKKIKTIIITVFVCLFLANYSVSAQSGGLAEIEFTNYVKQADAEFDVGNIQGTEQNLTNAGQILNANPNLSIYLKGHYNKVKGKLYMTSSLTTALQYFNTSLSQFSAFPADQAKVKVFVGIAYYYAQDINAAETYLNEAKFFFTNNNESENLAQSLNNLGVLAYYKGDSDTAMANCNQAYSINTANGDSSAASKNLQNINYFMSGGLINFKASSSDDKKDESEPEIIVNDGGGGSQGSGGTIKTNGGGTVVGG